jgi:LAO/AO transport system kinase
MVREYREFVSRSGYLSTRRGEQSRYWMNETIREGIFEQVFSDPDMQKELEDIEKSIVGGKITSFMAAAIILKKYKSGNKNS